MSAIDERIRVPLPRDWPQRVRSGAIHAIFLARFSLPAARGHAAHSWNPRTRLREKIDRLRQEVALLILELRAARGWSLARTARHLLVTPLAVARWNR